MTKNPLPTGWGEGECSNQATLALAIPFRDRDGHRCVGTISRAVRGADGDRVNPAIPGAVPGRGERGSQVPSDLDFPSGNRLVACD